MSFTQLHPTIPMTTPRGKGYAIGVIDYSTEHNICWVIGLDNGEIWTFQNPEVRMQSNITMGRGKSDIITPEIGAMLQKANDELAAISNCAKCGATWASFYVCKDMDCRLGRNVAQSTGE